MFQKVVATIDPQNIYNMDETGFGTGMDECSKVIIDQNILKTCYKTHPGGQEWVLVVECICADRTTVPPLFLFKGEGVNVNCIAKAILDNWCFAASSNGWTSNFHELKWLRQCFEPHTGAKAAGLPQILLCNGHNSHISANFIAHCMDHNIVLLVMPPYTSHLIQPLDISIFGPLKTYLACKTDFFLQTGLSWLLKHKWVQCYHAACLYAFQPANIASGFRLAGLIPFLPNTIY